MISAQELDELELKLTETMKENNWVPVGTINSFVTFMNLDSTDLLGLNLERVGIREVGNRKIS